MAIIRQLTGKSNFEWDEAKNLENQEKHGVSFYDAQHAFKDERRVIPI